LGWAVIQYDWCPFGKGESLEANIHMWRTPCGLEHYVEIKTAIYKLRREVQADPPSQSSEGTTSV
jgi:hypothetical protein